MIYLAIPYSHPDPKVREARFIVANRVAATLIAGGEHVFSPITHAHPMAKEHDLPIGWEYWAQYDRKFLRLCDRLVVVGIPGYDESEGVKAEIGIAYKLGVKVSYLVPEPEDVSGLEALLGL